MENFRENSKFVLNPAAVDIAVGTPCSAEFNGARLIQWSTTPPRIAAKVLVEIVKKALCIWMSISEVDTH